MKRQRIKSKRRRLWVLARRTLLSLAEIVVIIVATLARGVRGAFQALRNNEDVILTIGLFGMAMIFMAVVFLWAFWDVIVLYFS